MGRQKGSVTRGKTFTALRHRLGGSNGLRPVLWVLLVLGLALDYLQGRSGSALAGRAMAGLNPTP